MSNKPEEHRHEEKLEAVELNKKTLFSKTGEGEERELTPLQSKISNFWYYNKWKVLISLFLTVVIVFSTVQMCSNYEEDVIVFYSGSFFATSDKISSLNSMLSVYLPRDYNGDGEKRAELNPVSVYSQEQIDEYKKLAETDDNYSEVDASYNASQLQSFDTVLLSGEYSICFIEEWLYRRAAVSGGFRKLSDVLGVEPENTINGEAMYLSDTAIYKDNPGLFDGFNEKTVVCLRTESQIGRLFGKKGSSEEYQFAEEYFRNLVLGINS